MRDDSFNYAVDSVPLGHVIRTPADLELLYPGKFLRLDGRYINPSRLDYRLKHLFNIGKVTWTARTTAGGSATGGVTYGNPAVSPTYIVVRNDCTGTVGLQYSSNQGASWATTTLALPSGILPDHVIWAGTRFIVAFQAATQPYVTSGDNPNSTWSATSGATVSSVLQRLAYSPQLGLTLHCNNTSTTYYGTLPDGSTTWTARSVTAAPNADTTSSIVWTGKRFIIFTRVSNNLRGMHYSETGTSGWAWKPLDFYGYSASGGYDPVSDGNGTIVMNASLGRGFIVSKDHGDTWRFIKLDALGEDYQGFVSPMLAATYLTYSEGRFFGGMQEGRLIASRDAINWQVENCHLAMQGLGPVYPLKVVSVGGVLINYNPNSGTATATVGTGVEDLSLSRLPSSRHFAQASQYHGGPQEDSFLKVRN